MIVGGLDQLRDGVVRSRAQVGRKEDHQAMSIAEGVPRPQPLPDGSPWNVPFGFSTCELSQTMDGPILGGDGQPVEYGPRIHSWSIQRVYGDGAVRVVVRPGNRGTYSAPGHYMSFGNMAGEPGQHFGNAHAALAAAATALQELPHCRRALAADAAAG